VISLDINQKKDGIKKKTFRAARIVDFVKILEFESFAKTNVLNIAGDCPPDDFEKVLLEPLAQQRAYTKTITFMKDIFKMNGVTEKECRAMRHKGGLILKTLEFSDKNIEECNETITFLEGINNKSSSKITLIKYFDIQAECYSHISYMINRNLIRNKNHEYHEEEMFKRSIDRIIQNINEGDDEL